jgi:hypothetical protein
MARSEPVRIPSEPTAVGARRTRPSSHRTHGMRSWRAAPPPHAAPCSRAPGGRSRATTSAASATPSCTGSCVLLGVCSSGGRRRLHRRGSARRAKSSSRLALEINSLRPPPALYCKPYGTLHFQYLGENQAAARYREGIRNAPDAAVVLYLWRMKLIRYASWQRLVTLRQDEECPRRPLRRLSLRRP